MENTLLISKTLMLLCSLQTLQMQVDTALHSQANLFPQMNLVLETEIQSSNCCWARCAEYFGTKYLLT